MRSGLLLLAAVVALSGVLLSPARAASISSGPCHQWLEMVNEHNEEKAKKKHECEQNNNCEPDDGEYDKHDLKYDMIPECDDHGYFMPKQCHVFKSDFEWCDPSKHCYTFEEGDEWCACVDVKTGMPDKSTMTQHGDNLHCDAYGHIEPYCDLGWEHFGSHGHAMCYKFINSKKTWVEAESYCQFEGGNLASIHCPETSHFFQTLTRGNSHNFPLTWVGGHNAVQGCFWMWSNGQKFDYDDWNKVDSKNREHSCLSINEGFKLRWSAGCCNQTLPFICEKEMHKPWDYHPY